MLRLGGQGFIFKKCKRVLSLKYAFSLFCLNLEKLIKALFAVWLSQDPFLVISKITESGIIVPICKTEVLKNDHNPKWKQVFLSIQQVGSKVQKIGARIMHHYDITSQSSK